MLFFSNCSTVIRGAPRLVAIALRLVACGPWYITSTRTCFQTLHNHSHGTPVPVIRYPSHSEGRPECTPRVWYSPELDVSKFTLHILSDTPAASERLKYILLMTKHCPKCGMRMLYMARNSSWCCFNSLFPPLQLCYYRPDIDASLSEDIASDISWSLPKVLSFSTISVHCSCQHLHSPANVVQCGQAYHRMSDIEWGEHLPRWFLDAQGDRHQIPLNIEVGFLIVQQIEWTLRHLNAYIEKFRLLCDQPAGVPDALEHKNQPSTPFEIATVLQINSITNSSPCRVHVWRNHSTAHEGEFVDILSSYYEPLQFPLICLHTSLGR